MIREIKNNKDMKNSVKIIVNSFKTARDEFNLTEENCQTHPSFITYEKFTNYMKKGF